MFPGTSDEQCQLSNECSAQERMPPALNFQNTVMLQLQQMGWQRWATCQLLQRQQLCADSRAVHSNAATSTVERHISAALCLRTQIDQQHNMPPTTDTVHKTAPPPQQAQHNPINITLPAAEIAL